MSYVATIPVVFPCSADKVYEALCDLGTHSLWNTGMVSISHTGQMKEGLRYETESILPGGLISKAEIEVLRLVPNKEIELANYSGMVAYRMHYQLVRLGPNRTKLLGTLKFEFQNFVLDLARPVIEGMAEARLRGDMETFKLMLCGEV